MKKGTIAKILVLLMLIQAWFLGDLSRSYEWNPEKFFKNLCHIMSSLSPKEAHAGVVTVFGPEKYIRTTGKPNVYLDTFAATAGTAQFIILNGEENGQKRVSSAIISLNGTEIFGTRDFNKNVYRLQKSIELTQMTNTLRVELRSKPESYLHIEIIVTTANNPPIANASQDQHVIMGSLVTLDGRDSSDPDGDLITYNWAIITAPSGSIASLNNSTSEMPTFNPDIPGEYRISLIVNDGQADSAPDEVIIIATMPGPIMVTVPDVVGLAQAAAESAIVAAGLTVGAIAWDYHDTIPPGNVITQNPAGGSTAAEGSPVDVVISLDSSVRQVGPEGGILQFPNGVILDIPPGAVNETLFIEITDLSCDEVDAIILSQQQFATHKKRCLRGFSAKPDGLVFNVPIKAIVPVILEPGEIPVQIEVDVSNNVQWTIEAELVYRGNDGIIEMNMEHFSDEWLAALANHIDETCKLCSTYMDDLCGSSLAAPNPWFDGLQPGACLLLDAERKKCAPGVECCMEKLMHIKATEADFSSGQCQIVGAKLSVTYPECLGSPTLTDSLGEIADCPEDMDFKIKILSDPPWIFACQQANLKAELTGISKDGEVLFEAAKFPADWKIIIGDPNVAQLGADIPPNGIIVEGGREAGDVLIRASAIGAENNIFADYTLSVISNIGSFTISPFQETIKVSDGRILTAEIIGAQGNPLDPSTVSWSSSDPSIAYVTQETGGWTSVEGMDCGAVTITAKYQYDNCEPVEATATITVEDRVSYCQVNPPAITLSVGQVTALEVIPYDAQGNEATDVENFITWSPSDDITAWASPSIGLLTVVGANNIGQSWITATYNYPSTTKCGQKSCQAQVTVNCELCTFNVRPSAQTLNIGDVTTLRAELLDVNGDLVNILPPSTVTWTSNSGIVSFNPATGLQTSVKAGNTGVAKITATYTDMFGQKTATATIRVIVPPKTWQSWSQVGNFNNMKLGADGHGNTFVAWQERSLPEEDMLPGSPNHVAPRTVYTGICLGHIGSGKITPIAPCEGPVDAVLTNFFVDKMGNIIVTYYTHFGSPPDVEFRTWVKRYNVDSGWDETPALILHQEAGGQYYPPQALRFAADSNGNAIVVWKDYIGWYKSTIWALRYDAGQGWQSQPQFVQDIRRREAMSVIDAVMDVGIAMDSLGNAIVVWPRYLPDEDRYGIFAKRYRVDSGWDPDLRRIALPTDIGYLDIEMDSNGNAIVVWYNPDVGIRAKHYDANADDWPPIVINIADLPSTIYGDPSPAISMDESGNALVTYWQRDTVSSVLVPMSKGYSIEHGWGDAVTLMVNHPMLSMSVASMYGGGNATFVNVSPITTYDYASWVDSGIYYCCSTKVNWDIHSSASEFRAGEGWGETVSDTVSLESPVCYSMRYTNAQNWVVYDYVCYESHSILSGAPYHAPNLRFYQPSNTPPIIDSHGNATAVTLISKEHWIGDFFPDPVNFELSWMPTHYVYEYSEVIVMRFE